jgi:hypothetical protein
VVVVVAVLARVVVGVRMRVLVDVAHWRGSQRCAAET